MLQLFENDDTSPVTCWFFTIFFITCAPLKGFCLYMKLLQSSTIFKQKHNPEVSCNFLHEIFHSSQFKKYNATLRIVAIEKSELTFLLILYR